MRAGFKALHIVAIVSIKGEARPTLQGPRAGLARRCTGNRTIIWTRLYLLYMFLGPSSSADRAGALLAPRRCRIASALPARI